MSSRISLSNVPILIALLGAAQCRPAPESAALNPDTTATPPAQVTQVRDDLGGTSWRLVKFQGGDGTTLIPDDKAKYTIAFGTDGRANVRIDCNRGSGTWKSSGPPQLEFGPLALTRAMCPPGSLHDQITRQWQYVRSYVMRDGHLFLALMADGGIYEYEPASAEESEAAVIKGTATYRERMALPPGAVLEATLEDVSRAHAAAEVFGQVRVEEPGNPPFQFEIRYGSSRIVPNRRYAVRMRILVGGKPFFTTDQNYPVQTAGNGNVVQVMLRRAGESGPAALQPSAVSLENTYGRLTYLGGTPITEAAQRPELISSPPGGAQCDRIERLQSPDGRLLTEWRPSGQCPD
jgi:uncharacterized lipoprotein YbaY/heat shock protein HslJ